MDKLYIYDLINAMILDTPTQFKKRLDNTSEYDYPLAFEKYKRFFTLMFDPQITFGVSHTLVIEDDFNSAEVTDDFYNVFDKLASRELTGYAAITAVQALTPIYGDYVFFMLRKKVGGNIGIKQLNKALGYNYISDRQVMRYTDYNEKNFDSSRQYVAARKYDGNFLVISEGHVYTRGLHEIPVHNLAPEIEALALTGRTYFGEAIVEEGKLGARYKLAGMLTKLRKESLVSWNGITIELFDSITNEEWNQQKNIDHLKYVDRLQYCIDAVKVVQSSFISVAEHILATDKAHIDRLISYELADSYEGIVLTPTDNLYSFKRSKECLRYKELKTADLFVIDTLKGKQGTAFEDKMGSLVCKGQIGDQFITVTVGSGFTHADREDMNWYGKLVEIAYNEIKDGTLILARYIRTREAGETDEFN